MDNLKYESVGPQEAAQEIASDTIPFLTVIETDIAEFIQGRRAYCIAKRMLDIVVATVALLLLIPFFMLLALIIFIDDPHGSPLFVSTRCGLYGRHFKFIKFRSMRKGAEQYIDELLHANEMDGPVFKIKDDPRITRVGRFIRKCSIDELPQLINVIKGEMSLVGPRPPIPREVEQYTAYHMSRLTVRPGLTCYWQVQPCRNTVPFEEWVELDIRYIHERSMKGDVQLIFKTIGVMFKCEGE